MAITFLFLSLAVRFLYIQVFWSEELNYRAIDQWTREIPIVAERGKVVDRNGVVLADNNTAYSVFARSNAVKEVEKTAETLSKILGIDQAKLYDKLTKKKASEVTLAKKVDKSVIEKLSTVALDGIYYARDNVRFYPKNDALCQVLGFTSTDNPPIEKYSYIRINEGGNA